MSGEDSAIGNVTAESRGVRPRSRGVGGTKPIDGGNGIRDSDSRQPGTGTGNGRAGTGRVVASPSRTEAETVPLGKPSGREIAAEAIENAALVMESPKNTMGQKITQTGAEVMAFMEMSLIGAFGSMAVFTGHPHWNKSAEQLLPITGPVMRYWNSLPKKTQEAFAKRFNLALFTGGIIAVVGPDVTKEIVLRKVEDAERTIRRSNLKIVRGGPSGEGQSAADNDSAVPAAPPDAFVSPI